MTSRSAILIHKLGGVYVSLPCLPPNYSSQLSGIFVLGLFHSSDRVRFGNGMIFRRIIDEINYLSHTGFVVDTDVFQGTIKFRLGALTGDNLGLHSMLGFVERFSANYPCDTDSWQKNVHTDRVEFVMHRKKLFEPCVMKTQH